MTPPSTDERSDDATGARGVPFLQIPHDGDGDLPRVVMLPDGVDVTLGRSPTASIVVAHYKVSSMHAAIRHDGDTIVLIDLCSRTGTFVNSERLRGARRVGNGDTIEVGPLTAVVNAIVTAPPPSLVADATTGCMRLIAEIDRALRYARPLAMALLCTTNVAALDVIGRSLRPMDLLCAHRPGEYLLVMPELDGPAAVRATKRVLATMRALDPTVTGGVVACPEDGAHIDALVGRAREAATDLAWREPEGAIAPRNARARTEPPLTAVGDNFRSQLANMERTAIVGALEDDKGNQSRAARRLGISRRALINKMERYGLKARPVKR